MRLSRRLLLGDPKPMFLEGNEIAVSLFECSNTRKNSVAKC